MPVHAGCFQVKSLAGNLFNDRACRIGGLAQWGDPYACWDSAT